ncbi:MAG: IS21 family transposase [Deltaproteobacteria bacterium]|jgi:hypothetical protein|nr:IS21 family transposase [Deltaproteobacteria bacterium]MBW2532048.1 IS21 family transposase [Deltaproteobacteria bacterium]
MEEFRKHGQLDRAALKAAMDRKTARKYLKLGKLPSELKRPERTWRTRPDPFEADWRWVEEKLTAAPDLEAKILFEALQERHPERYHEGQLRTFQRRVKRWRATKGPDKEIFFPQLHRPGEAMQTDFTWATTLEVTIATEPFAHMLCEVVLPYSNWQWLTVCLSESYLALKRGVQEALFRLGRHPEWHQTDNTTAATHQPAEGKRVFNKDYQELIAYLGMKPRTIKIGKKEQNGDVEAAHGALKRWLEQHLKLRGSRDFESIEAYEQWLGGLVERRNRLRHKRLAEELAAMAPLQVARLAEFRELDVRVTSYSTIRVAHNTYSVPSRLRDEWVRVRLYERRLEIRYGGELQLEVERLQGRFGHRIDYRHIIWSLVRKPGAFARYRYREGLFPSLAFRRTYDAIHEQRADVRGDLEYLRILHLAAATMESEVEAALECLLEAGGVPNVDAVRELVEPDEIAAEHAGWQAYEVELGSYDELLSDEEVAS